MTHLNRRSENLAGWSGSVVVKEDGFEDIGLRITEKTVGKETITFIGQGLFQGDTVGLKFETWKEYQPGALPDGGLNAKTGYTQESVKISSIGLQSDNLIRALSKLYNIPTTNKFTGNGITASAFSLSSQHVDLSKPTGYFKSKLFIEETSEELYCEIYFNINLDNGIIELPEKDVDSRENLIKVLFLDELFGAGVWHIFGVADLNGLFWLCLARYLGSRNWKALPQHLGLRQWINLWNHFLPFKISSFTLARRAS